jgi:HAD superfamily hydrolase (TIGR01509 family)
LTDVRALLLDLGGVLVDVSFDRAFRAWSAASGIPAAQLAERFRRDADYLAHECGTLTDSAFFASLRKALGLALPDEAMLAGWNAILGEPFPGVTELVRRAATKLPVYVFSNTNTAHVTHFTPRYRELFAPVRKLIYSCELGCRKPDREAFSRVAAQMGVPGASILFMDDLAENVEGAKAAGLQARHVPSPDVLAPILAPWTR